MEALFLRILNMSIGAGWLILAAVLFRFVFKNAPKRCRCIVWALVAIRLVCPLTIQSPLSLVPSAAEVPASIISSAAQAQEPRQEQDAAVIQTDLPIVDTLINGDNAYIAINGAVFSVSVGDHGQTAAVLLPADAGAEQRTLPETGSQDEHASAAAETETANGAGRFFSVAAPIWLAGAALMLAYAAYSYIRLYKRTRIRETVRDNIIRCDEVETPFILGIFRPRIVIPTSISADDAAFAIAHENAHIERHDHLIKPFAFLLLAIHWFNPLMWLGYVLLSRDIELACDEKVISSGGAALKKSYSIALINCSIPASAVSACPLAFGEIGVKSRIRSVLDYKRPKWTTVVAALLCCAAIAVFFLPGPVKSTDAEPAAKNGAAAAAADDADYDRFYILHEPGAAMTADENTFLSLAMAEHRYRIDYPGGGVSLGSFRYKDSLEIELTEDESGRCLMFRKQNYDLVPENEAGAEGSVFELCAICSAQEYLFMYEKNGCAYYPDTGELLVYGDFETAYLLLNGSMPDLPAGKSAAVREALNEALSKDGKPTVSSCFVTYLLSPLCEQFGECTALVRTGQQPIEIVFTCQTSVQTDPDASGSKPSSCKTPGIMFPTGTRRYSWW